MTDKHLIETMKICCAGACDWSCNYDFDKHPECMESLLQDALELIQRQQERIERLKDNLDAVLKERADHTEAIEEFVDKVVDQLEEQTAYVGCSFAPKEKMTKIIKTDKAIAIVKGVQNE